jgi:murein DD-endopeptidase MepM/ murein hydrolase activator NlpD
MDFDPTLKGVSKDLEKIVSLLGKWSDINKRVAESTKKVVQSANGDGKIGVGTNRMMDGAMASFSGLGDQYKPTRNLLQAAMPSASAGKVAMVTSAIGNAPQILGGMNQMMPDVGETFNRMRTSYSAQVAGGFASRKMFESATFSAIGQNNQTGLNSDVQTGQYLVGRGMSIGSSTFNQTLKTVGGVSQFMGMSNQAAGAAVEGLSSGAGSAGLLKNFGIYTGNPATGESLSPNQIIQQIKGRLTQGRGKYTTADVQDSLRKGSLGVTLQNSGLTPDQQSMVVAGLMGDATDSTTGSIDFDSQESMSAASKKLGGNPDQPFMKIFGSQNKAMGKAEDAYAAGADVAAASLTALNEAAGTLAQTFGGLTAAMAVFGGAQVGQGAMSLLGGAGNVGATGLMSKYGGKLGGAAGGAGGIGGMLGKAGGVLKGAGAVGGAIGVGVNAMSAYDSAKQGADGWSVAGSALSGAASGALMGATIGSIIPGVGTAAGAIAGGIIGAGASLIGSSMGGAEHDAAAGTGAGGGRASLMGGGYTGVGGGDSQVNGTSTKPFRLAVPVRKNTTPTATFGQKEYQGQTLWPNGHNGVDYPVGEGTPIYASADGEVSFAGGGQGAQLGFHIMIKHPNSPGGNMHTVYAHLSSVQVTQGQQVMAGSLIGLSGKSGTKITGAHLHFGLCRNGNTANSLDPAPYMGGAVPANTQEDTGPAAADSNAAAASGSAGSGTGAMSTSRDSLPAANVIGSSVTSGVSGISGSATTIAGLIGSSGGSTAGGSMYDVPDGAGAGGDSMAAGVAESYAGSGVSLSSMSGRKSSGGGGNNVTINLTIGQASEAEARRFAKLVKGMLESEEQLMRVGRA